MLLVQQDEINVNALNSVSSKMPLNTHLLKTPILNTGIINNYYVLVEKFK